MILVFQLRQMDLVVIEVQDRMLKASGFEIEHEDCFEHIVKLDEELVLLDPH